MVCHIIAISPQLKRDFSHILRKEIVVSAPFLIGVLLVAIGLIVLLILKFRLHAFIALTIAAFFVALVTQMPLDQIAGSIEKGVGGTLGFLAVIIGLGSILGSMLEVSGGAERIASTLLNALGKERATWVMMIVGFIAGIPVFVEVGFVLLVPLVYVIARDTGLNKTQIAVPLALSLMTVHCIVPPHPAAMAICATLGADVGKVIVFGLLVGLPCAIIGGPVFSKYFNKMPAMAPSAAGVKGTPEDIPADAAEKIEETTKPKDLPGFGITLLTILLPLLIMVGKTILGFVIPADHAAMPVINLIGNPITALLISVFFAYYSLGLSRGLKLADLLKVTENSFGPIAGILLIIGAGGAFNQILMDSGIGNALASVLSGLPISPILLAWLIAGIMHFAVGSATVAMISAAGIVLPLMGATHVSPEMMAIAIGCGAIGWTHVTDSLFWLIKEYMGMSLVDTLKNVTVPMTIASFVGLGVCFLASYII